MQSPMRQQVANLVMKVKPNTIVGRQPTIEEGKSHTHFLIPVEKKVVETLNNSDVFIINDFQDFYNLVSVHEIFQTNSKIKDFVKFVDKIPGACSCNRNALKQTAQGMYSQILPFIQVENPDFFPIIKQITKAQKVIFKEKNISLLEV